MNTEPASPSWRKYLTFSVRGLIALVLVIGLGLGWIVRNAHIQRDAVAAIRKAGGEVWYDFDPKDQVFAWYELSGWKKQIGESIGIDYVAHVVCVRLVSGGNEVDRQQALPRLAVLCEVQGDRTCTIREGRAIPALANRPETRRDLSLNLRPPEWGFVEPRHRREIRTVPQ